MTIKRYGSATGNRALLRIPPFVVMLVFAFLVECLLAGCGGSGGGHGGSHSDNLYAGTYAGVFEDEANVIAPFTMTVLKDGTLSGQFSYTAGAKTFTGSVKNDGIGQLTTNGGASALNLTLSGQTTLGGGVANTNENGAYFVAIANPTGSFGGPNPFTGAFAGSVQNTTIGKTGIDAFVIDGSGNVTGSALISVNGTPTLTGIGGTLSAAGAIQYFPVVEDDTISGNVTLSNGTITGTLTDDNSDTLKMSLTAVQ